MGTVRTRPSPLTSADMLILWEQIYVEHMCVGSVEFDVAFSHARFTEGDVGGQRTLRPYWRNYFEQTDALVWVVDSTDRMRMKDCKEELHELLQEDVSLTLGCCICTLLCSRSVRWCSVLQGLRCWCLRINAICRDPWASLRSEK